MSLSLKHEHEHERYVDNEMCVAFLVSSFGFVDIVMLKSILLLRIIAVIILASPACPQNNTDFESIQSRSEVKGGRCVGEWFVVDR